MDTAIPGDNVAVAPFIVSTQESFMDKTNSLSAAIGLASFENSDTTTFLPYATSSSIRDTDIPKAHTLSLPSTSFPNHSISYDVFGHGNNNHLPSAASEIGKAAEANISAQHHPTMDACDDKFTQGVHWSIDGSTAEIRRATREKLSPLRDLRSSGTFSHQESDAAHTPSVIVSEMDSTLREELLSSLSHDDLHYALSVVQQKMQSLRSPTEISPARRQLTSTSAMPHSEAPALPYTQAFAAAEYTRVNTNPYDGIQATSFPHPTAYRSALESPYSSKTQSKTHSTQYQSKTYATHSEYPPARALPQVRSMKQQHSRTDEVIAALQLRVETLARAMTDVRSRLAVSERKALEFKAKWEQAVRAQHRKREETREEGAHHVTERQMIEALEEMKMLSNTNASLVRQLDILLDDKSGLSPKLVALSEELRSERRRIRLLKEENDRLRAQVDRQQDSIVLLNQANKKVKVDNVAAVAELRSAKRMISQLQQQLARSDSHHAVSPADKDAVTDTQSVASSAVTHRQRANLGRLTKSYAGSVASTHSRSQYYKQRADAMSVRSHPIDRLARPGVAVLEDAKWIAERKRLIEKIASLESRLNAVTRPKPAANSTNTKSPPAAHSSKTKVQSTPSASKAKSATSETISKAAAVKSLPAITARKSHASPSPHKKSSLLTDATHKSFTVKQSVESKPMKLRHSLHVIGSHTDSTDDYTPSPPSNVTPEQEKAVPLSLVDMPEQETTVLLSLADTPMASSEPSALPSPSISVPSESPRDSFQSIVITESQEPTLGFEPVVDNVLEAAITAIDSDKPTEASAMSIDNTITEDAAESVTPINTPTAQVEASTASLLPEASTASMGMTLMEDAAIATTLTGDMLAPIADSGEQPLPEGQASASLHSSLEL